MKKITFVLIALLLLLTGCTPDNPGPEPTPPAPEDVGMTQEEFWNKYCVAEPFKGPDGYCFQFAGKDEFDYWMEGTSYGRGGHISSFEYVGTGEYHFVVDVPAFAGNEMDDPYDAYSADFYCTLRDYSDFDMDVKGDVATGYYKSVTGIIGEEIELNEEDEYLAIGDRILLTFWSMDVKGGFGYNMTPAFDQVSFGTTLFDDSYDIAIWSSAFDRMFAGYKVDDMLFITAYAVTDDFKDFADGDYVEVINLRTLETVLYWKHVRVEFSFPDAKDFTITEGGNSTKYEINGDKVNVIGS